MKLLIILTSAILMSAANMAFASTQKICFGAKNNPDTQGVAIKLSVSPDKISFKVVKGETYVSSLEEAPTKPGPSSKSKDGKTTYLSFSGGGEDNESFDLIVDSSLLKAGTQGLFVINHTVEGEKSHLVYFCKDDAR